MTDEISFGGKQWGWTDAPLKPSTVEIMRAGEKVVSVYVYFEELPVNERRWLITPLPGGNGINVRAISDSNAMAGDSLDIKRKGLNIEDTVPWEVKGHGSAIKAPSSETSELTQEVYKSSTLGPISLSFTGRRLMQNLREAVSDYMGGQTAVSYHDLSKARGKIAQYISSLEKFKIRALAQEKLARNNPDLSTITDTELVAELNRRLNKLRTGG